MSAGWDCGLVVTVRPEAAREACGLTVIGEVVEERSTSAGFVEDIESTAEISKIIKL